MSTREREQRPLWRELRALGTKMFYPGPQPHGSKETKANERRGHQQLMVPSFPKFLSPSPWVSAFSLLSLPPNFVSVFNPIFPQFHCSSHPLCARHSPPALPNPCPALPCLALCPKSLTSQAHHQDPLTLDSADPGGTDRRSEARGEAVEDVSPSPGPSVSCCGSHPSFAGCWYPLPHLGFWLLTAAPP